MNIVDTFTQLNKLPPQPIRLGILGAPGEGKTWSGLTFPNPIVLNLDNKLGGYQAAHPESTIKVVNFDENLVVNILKCSNMGFNKPNNPQYPLNVRDAVKKWLTQFGPTLGSDSTLILDSWSTLQNKFDGQSQLPHEIVVSRSGEEDKFAFWRLKQKYAKDITDLLKTLKCNSVTTFHEVPEYDEDGRITGKLKPVMQGGFAAELAGHFSSFYRQICVTKDMKNYDKIKAALGRDINGEREYLWQTQSNSVFTACAGIPNLPTLVPATYQSLVKIS